MSEELDLDPKWEQEYLRQINEMHHRPDDPEKVAKALFGMACKGARIIIGLGDCARFIYEGKTFMATSDSKFVCLR